MLIIMMLSIFVAPYIAGKITKIVLYKHIQLWKKALYIIATLFLTPLTVVGFLGITILALIGTDAFTAGTQVAAQSTISIIICVIYITVILLHHKMKNRKKQA